MNTATIEKPVKKPRLTGMETRAFNFCERLKRNDGGTVNVEWRKSRDYGHCPAAFNWHGEKIAYASGCGYDKISAVLSDALSFLAPEGERIHCHGHGLNALTRRLAECGWKLEQTANGNTFDSFSLSRLPSSEEKS